MGIFHALLGDDSAGTWPLGTPQYSNTDSGGGSLPLVRYLAGGYIPVVSSWNRTPEYNFFNFGVGIGLLSIALVFFALGLDDDKDYLRAKHAGWHFFVSAASFWLWRSVLRHQRPQKNAFSALQQDHLL